MKTIFIPFILFSLLIIHPVVAEKPAYRIYTSKGKEVKYKDLLKKVEKADVVFFGELHNNPICHWLQFELTKDLFALKHDSLILGAEMFETDNQLIINEYTRQFIRKKDFESQARLWSNYQTDYAPILDFASEHQLKFIATNIPRRYAALVNSQGFSGLDSLSGYQRALIAPLPIKYDTTLDCYRKMTGMLSKEKGNMHKTMYIAEAQAIKDATMGYFIRRNLEEGKTILHFNGTYHSDHHEGIVWYLNEYSKRYPEMPDIITISSIEQNDTDTLHEDYLGIADFIICIPESMTKTY